MTWLQTHSGRAYNYREPLPSSIDINDIAHALSNLCRFAGHCNRFYSVAEHSILVSHLVPQEYALHGLVHDATEAYVVDVPKPLKDMLGPEYAGFEWMAWKAIRERFSLVCTEVAVATVKMADNRMLLAERDQLLLPPPIPWTWAAGIDPAPVRVQCYPPAEAKLRFLDRFYQLNGARA